MSEANSGLPCTPALNVHAVGLTFAAAPQRSPVQRMGYGVVALIACQHIQRLGELVRTGAFDCSSMRYLSSKQLSAEGLGLPREQSALRAADSNRGCEVPVGDGLHF